MIKYTDRENKRIKLEPNVTRAPITSSIQSTVIGCSKMQRRVLEMQ